MKQETILQKLNNLEQLLQQDEKPLSFIEACKYLNLSQSHLYKLTSQGKITHFKPSGKKLYFKKSDLSSWIFRNQRKGDSELEQKAIDYVFNGEVKDESN
jgi:excisionase family DNA binding protein